MGLGWRCQLTQQNMEYYKQWECPRCYNEIYSLGLNLVERNGRPVFDVTMFEAEYVSCDAEGWRNPETDEWIPDEQFRKLDEKEVENYIEECGCEFGTGDIEIMEA